MNKYLINTKELLQADKVMNTIEEGKITGKKFFLSQIYNIIFLLILVSLFFIEFGHVIFSHKDISSLIGSMSIMFIGSFMTAMTYRIKAFTEGKTRKGYKDSKDLLDKVSRQYTDEDIKMLDKKITNYFDELEKARIELKLKKVDLTYSDYEQYKSFGRKELRAKRRNKDLTKKQTNVIIWANRYTIERFSAVNLLSDTDSNIEDDGLGKSEKQLNTQYIIMTAIKKLVPMVVFAYLTVDFLTEITLAGLGLYFMKIIFMIFSAISAYYTSSYEFDSKVVGRIERQLYYHKLLGKNPDKLEE